MPTSSTPLRAAIAGGVLALASTFTGHATAQSPSGPIILGTSLPLTGPHASTGKEVLSIMQSYVQRSNQQGGIGGRPLQLVALDDQFSASQAELNARRLIENGAVALLNCLGTSICNAMLPVLQSNHTPLVGAMAGSGLLRESSARYVFNLRASTESEISAMVQQIQSVGQNRIALVYQSDDFGRSSLQTAHNAFRAAKLTPVSELALQADGRNAAELAKTLSSLENLHGVIVLASAPATSALITQSRKLQVGSQFYNLAAQANQALVQGLGEHTRGVVFATLVPSPWKTAIPAVKNYQQLLSSPGQPQPSYLGLEAYLNIHTLTEGLRKAGADTSRAKLVTTLDGLGDLQYGPMRVRFAQGRHQGSGYVGLAMLNQQGGFIE